jgi:hypothetical protein
MKKAHAGNRGFVIICLPALISAASFNSSITINTSQNQHQISPYIYGSNADLSGKENFTMRRQGGNRMTGYNWENNASNAGSDWNQSSDDYMTSALGISSNQSLVPAITVTSFIDSCRKHNCFSLITLQMAGYVAADKKGTVDSASTAPSARWKSVTAKKGSSFANPPDTSDNNVYMDEFINYLEKKYAPASDPWLGGCALDNEPALWPSTHPRLHPAQPTCTELITKSIALSSTVKSLDPVPLIFGPVTFGFSEMTDFQGAPDWNTVKGTYSWFVDYYLDKMKTASQTAGVRLLDVFDIHWYSEAQGNNERIVGATNPAARANAQARLQAPRTLWDKNYKENSWIAQYYSSYLPLIPKMQASIDTYYPGTKIGFTEYNYGGESHISGGIAMADVMGIYGKYGVGYATYWQMETKTDFTSAAYRLYRNYDGNNATFGSVSVGAATSDSVRTSVYASLVSQTNNDLHIILLNKNYDSTMAATIAITGDVKYTTARIWGFDSLSSTITERLPSPAIVNNSLSVSVPRLTAWHCVLSSGASIRETRPSLDNPSGRVYNPLHESRLCYTLPVSEKASLSLFTLNGLLMKKWNNLSGHGSIAMDKGMNGIFLMILKSGTRTQTQTIIIASR